MKIYGFVATSTVDYPSKLVSTIFLGNCNLDCLYCHNKELIKPQNLEEAISEEELINYLKKRKNIIDGICISGGEPSLHGRKLIDFIKRLKNELGKNFLVKIDTNGTNSKFILEARNFIDYVAMDYKSYDYKKNLNIEKTEILKTMEILKSSNLAYEIRITMYPPYISLEDIPKIIKELKEVSVVYLQRYKEIKGKEYNYTLEDLENIRKEFIKNNIECFIR